MKESAVLGQARNKDKPVKTENMIELQDYYVNKPWKAIEDLPTHLPFSEQYKSYHTDSLPKLQQYYKQNLGSYIHKG